MCVPLARRPACLPAEFIALLVLLAQLVPSTASGAATGADAFAQLGPLLPTPTEVRLASGAPGPGYWQQRVDYLIDVRLDENDRTIEGNARITYHNRSPHALTYLWLQLDQNRYRPDSKDVLSQSAPDFERFSYSGFASRLARRDFDGGHRIEAVTGADGEALSHLINGTVMRVDLAEPLLPGESTILDITWHYPIIDAVRIGARSGYEYFEGDGNAIFEIAQWYPRLAAYTDYEGWQHKAFLGRGEFTLELGNFEVAITVPADHIVAATGVLENPEEVLSPVQLQRYLRGRQSDRPVFVVTADEAAANEREKAEGEQTWRFRADDVRDFAFASSRKFIWDLARTRSGNRDVLAMSFYPKEGEPLWSQYSTAAIIHTLDSYSRYTFDYPYPAAISVNGPVGGMEYPMISFNKPRPYADGTYWDQRQKPGDRTWERSKYGLISVIIHEVGHNYFPMIVNSDERQWAWMDEGLNTFLQFLAEQAWEAGYPSRRGEPESMVEYMTSERQVPIMTDADSIYQFGNNAYGKPATALNILRESVLGRELFDFAFREYACRWKFRRPTPADFFRTLEDASGVDLDWFWRGWFFGTDHVDVAIDDIELYRVSSRNPEVEKAWEKAREESRGPTLTERRNEGQQRLLARRPDLADFYNETDEYLVTPYDYARYEELLQSLEAWEREALEADERFYVITFENRGGLPTPLPLRLSFAEGEPAELQLPAELWRRDADRVRWLYISDRELTGVELDPYRATGDANPGNNRWPRRPEATRFELFKESVEPNPMRRQDPSLWEPEAARPGGDRTGPGEGPIDEDALEAGQDAGVP